MRRAASDQRFAKARDITREVARGFLEADQAEAECILHQGLKDWLEGRDEQLWVLGNRDANVKTLGEKIASFWKAKAVDLDALIRKHASDEQNIGDTVHAVLDALDDFKPPIVVYGYQVPFFKARAHVVIGLDLGRVKKKDREFLVRKDQPELLLAKWSQKNHEKEIDKMVKEGQHDPTLVEALLRYDPDDIGKTPSQESMPVSTRW